MNWDAIGAVGEVLGATAVVITLVYFSREIRHNAKTLSVTALRDTTAQWNHWSEMLATSPDLADIVAKGNADFASLSEPESLRYGAYVQSFFDNVESSRELVTDHQVESDLEVLSAIVGRRITVSGYRAWWNENTADYNAEFVAWVEAQDPTRNAS